MLLEEHSQAGRQRDLFSLTHATPCHPVARGLSSTIQLDEIRNYSYRKATDGSTRIAFRAGK